MMSPAVVAVETRIRGTQVRAEIDALRDQVAFLVRRLGNAVPDWAAQVQEGLSVADKAMGLVLRQLSEVVELCVAPTAPAAPAAE